MRCLLIVLVRLEGADPSRILFSNSFVEGAVSGPGILKEQPGLLPKHRGILMSHSGGQLPVHSVVCCCPYTQSAGQDVAGRQAHSKVRLLQGAGTTGSESDGEGAMKSLLALERLLGHEQRSTKPCNQR